MQPLLCSMSLISPNFYVKSIIFSQFWPGAFSQNCWKKPWAIHVPVCLLFFQSGRIGAEEDIDDFKGKTEAEIQEIIEEREAKANAQILKMVNYNKCSNIAYIDIQ